MKRACCLLLLSVLCQFASAGKPPYQIRRIDSGTIAFQGQIVKGSRQDLLAQLDSATTTLIVTSEGGSAEEGILIAEDLRKRNIQLVVEKYCLSSCANYLFLAAPQKSVNAHSLIGFHGAPLGSLSAEKEQEFQRGNLNSRSMQGEGLQNHLDRLAIRELEFFAEIGVDRSLYRAVDSLILAAVPAGSRTVTLQGKLTLKTRARQWEFGVSDQELETLGRKMAELDRKKLRYALRGHIERAGTAPNTAYFPSRATLEKYGVLGIGNYPYPVNDAELQNLVREVFDKDVNIIADFAAPEPPAG